MMKNNFFRKTSNKTKLSYNSIYFKGVDFSLIHFFVEKIKSWNFSLQYILKFSFFCNFFIVNKFRLKNIFLKVINDPELWREIDKMIDSGLISFEKKYIYRSFSFENLNSLSYFFFNVFVSEFDFYVFSRVSSEILKSFL